MAKQLHRKFPNEQVKSLLKRYLSKEIKIGYILEILSIKRSRFFELLKEYRKTPDSFSISYNNLEFRISGVPIRRTVQLRIIPDKVSGMAEIRFWHDNKLVGIEKVKNEDLKLVHF